MEVFGGLGQQVQRGDVQRVPELVARAHLALPQRVLRRRHHAADTRSRYSRTHTRTRTHTRGRTLTRGGRA